MEVQHHFSRHYEESREKFLARARSAGLAIDSHILPGLKGSRGEELATDVARFGPKTAEKLLVLSSGTHGVEGFCGSGCQSAMLGDEQVFARAEREGVSLLFVHAVNPYGFSYRRRVNEDNIDINRNFVTFGQSQTFNQAYAELEHLLLPSEWPPSSTDAALLDDWIRRHGVESYGQAVFQGQYTSPDGMFYGGSQPAWSNNTIRAIIRAECSLAKQIGWIDLHTGLGVRGHCEKVFIGRADELDRARAWWGADVISTARDDSVMYEIQGPMLTIVSDECPQAACATIALEFGTVSLLRMIDALRADHFCWRERLAADSEPRVTASAELTDSFYVDAPDWQGMVFAQARTAVVQALCGMAG